MASVNQEIADGVVSHRLALLRAETVTVRAVVAVYTRTLGVVGTEADRVAAAIAGGDDVPAAELRRLRRLQVALAASTRAAQAEIERRLSADLTTVAEGEGPKIAGIIEGALPEQVIPLFGGVPEVDVLATISRPLGGAVWSERLAVDLVAVHDTLRSALAVSTAQGASVPRAVEALRAAGLVAETYRGRLTSIVRTEIQRVANEVMQETYRQNQDVLRGVIHLSTLDSRTCVVCAGLHQKRYLYGRSGEVLPNPVTGPWRPNPQHPRCRCMDAPWVKSWRELGVPVTTRRDRERLDGREPEGMDYAQWLRRRPEAEQREVLGPTRYDLWRDGVALEDMSDAGRPLTVAELMA